MRATGPLLLLLAGLLLLAAVPDPLLRLVAGPGPRPEHGGSPTAPERPDKVMRPDRVMAPDLALRPLILLDDGLLSRLSDADRTWIPRAEPLEDGRVRYLYKRRPGDPELSLIQIRALIADPPSRALEQQRIVELLTALEQIGVSVALEEPLKAGAAAEWDPRARTLRIRPDVIDQGTLEFARVLNHESVHVAQSCAAGWVGSSPRPLGIQGIRPASRAAGLGPEATAPASPDPLRDPVYADLTPAERRMEEEAYILQNRLGVGRSLIAIHCSAGAGRPGGRTARRWTQPTVAM